jgi:CheY-like chemotaxis protein
LIDMNMPLRNGWGAIASLRTLAPALPIIIITARPDQGTVARDAALAYWRRQNGDGPVETRVTDFGCHVQVDIMSNNKIAKSLRYQNGTITEM